MGDAPLMQELSARIALLAGRCLHVAPGHPVPRHLLAQVVEEHPIAVAAHRWRARRGRGADVQAVSIRRHSERRPAKAATGTGPPALVWRKWRNSAIGAIVPAAKSMSTGT